MTREEWLIRECRAMAEMLDAIVNTAPNAWKATKMCMKDGTVDMAQTPHSVYFETRLIGAPK